MEPIKSIDDIVSFWPSVEAFAEAVSTVEDQVPVSRVFQWMRKNRVRTIYFDRILKAAEKRGVNLTLSDLAAIHTNGENT